MWPLYGFISMTALLLTVNALDMCQPKSCKVGLSSRKAACGSDGFSYPNRCFLEMSRCFNKNLTFKHRGTCTARQTCAGYGRAHSNSNFKFKPQCRADGNFASAQCHEDIGYCWCVTAQGYPIPLTTVPYRPGVKHRCVKGKKTTRRRSSSRNRNNSGGGGGGNKVCRREDRAVFNIHLVDIFISEWTHDGPHNRRIGNVTTDRVAIDWKFDTLDLNGDNQLDRMEYRELKQLIRKHVPPKKCAKSFTKTCDTDRNLIIARQEWVECLSRDGMDDRPGVFSNEGSLTEDEADYVPHAYQPSSILTGGDTRATSNSSIINEEESAERREEDVTDCLSDRKAAQDEDSQLYVPECTPDGRYTKVQCYKSAGYCWCVNEDTGKNIPGTAVKDEHPKCDGIASTHRPMKGCPEEKKIAFLKDLMEFLHTRMSSEKNGTSTSSINSLSRNSPDEQVASWSFSFFDENKNKQLDRTEWPRFKDVMSSIKKLKRCGKKLPRYCDINQDRHISLTEWLDCLNTNKYQGQLSTSSTGGLGENPLTVLIED